ncbi:SDR family NAD(P)-dependent oxidoreductase [Allonocardiopsis opalescens]|uniref:NAD(P)-dependent dehydrogenase (Short-subunit alcohol dehydrogenase family) n=1 Tax=Allonocardiopsis opalescens TaxID=1144618 RepID=A0A2T0Q767_9ACTN|nr:SDR family NAD(P)-dependent oxidoreductase [Allonocardiopsis opalescens]PRX99680.1 NAD(P)-dependent dehydrogenase (short-subunit alcohol dehydrogenase family) [Allonocardiopsis opalescens]
MAIPDTHIDMTGKTVVITGASSGIGAAAARRLAAQGATVVPVGRSPERTASVAAEIGAEPLVADFARLDEVRALAGALLDRCPRIDVLANNAGKLFARRQVTGDGHELSFQTNHLAPFLLTTLLLPRLRESAREAPVRVIATSSLGNRFGRLRLDDLEWEKRRYGGGWIAYSTTKLMNILFTRELARRTEGSGILAVSFHPDPGERVPSTRTTYTRFAESSPLSRLVARSPLRGIGLTGEDGAEPLIWLAASPEVAGADGAYFHGFRRDAPVHRQADDPELARRLWERSAELVAPYTRTPA